jgi:hypothetical protein
MVLFALVLDQCSQEIRVFNVHAVRLRLRLRLRVRLRLELRAERAKTQAFSWRSCPEWSGQIYSPYESEKWNLWPWLDISNRFDLPIGDSCRSGRESRKDMTRRILQPSWDIPSKSRNLNTNGLILHHTYYSFTQVGCVQFWLYQRKIGNGEEKRCGR